MVKFQYHITIPYAVFSVVLAAVHFTVMQPLLSLSGFERLCDSLIYGILSGILAFLLKEVARYGNYSSMPKTQVVANYSALAILFVTLSCGLNVCILCILFPCSDMAAALLPLLPVRALIALLLFGCLALSYGYWRQNEANELPEADANEPEAIPADGKQTEILERIAVKNGQKIDVVPVSEICLLQAEGDYVMLHSSKGKFLKEETMKYFEAHLPTDKFVRIHRSSIINVDYISRVELYDRQNQLVRLQNNLQVKMSLSGYKLLKSTLGL
ncbi:MAG: LytTR family transcriptional regulator DNA-binding domain-containing protein [Prevotella sp.]|jgi:hypothetical protein|nr:LytTR family transcriptional regulator DNA-binding domain-containing protein [Prevotella sp.]